MGRETHLTAEERQRIDEFHLRGISGRKIAQMLLRNQSTIAKYLSTRGQIKIERRGGCRRGSALNACQARGVLRALSNSSKSCAQVAREFNLPVSAETVRATVHRCSDFSFERKERTQQMTVQHMQFRFDWCVHHMAWRREWHNVIFSDEKKWSLDGPDGLAYYWHDPNKPKVTFPKRQNGGGGIMVWGCFSSRGTGELFVIENNANAQDYLFILESNLLPYIDRHGRDEMIFMQDNAAIHTARVVQEWFAEQQMTTLPWPAKSPDLNPIENLWGILTREVYKENKQYSSKHELRAAVMQAWAAIDNDTIQSLINSLPKRCVEVIQVEGKAIDY